MIEASEILRNEEAIREKYRKKHKKAFITFLLGSAISFSGFIGIPTKYKNDINVLGEEYSRIISERDSTRLFLSKLEKIRDDLTYLENPSKRDEIKSDEIKEIKGKLEREIELASAEMKRIEDGAELRQYNDRQTSLSKRADMWSYISGITLPLITIGYCFYMGLSEEKKRKELSNLW